MLATACISGVSVFLNKFAVGVWSNSSAFTTAKNAAVALLLTSCILCVAKRAELRALSRRSWVRIALLGVVGGSLPFLLFFKGLTMTSAVNAAFIHKTLFIWVAALAVPILGERMSRVHAAALGLLLVGTFALSGGMVFRIGTGELLVFAATVLWSVEFLIAKVALRDVSPMVAAWARMSVGAVVLLGYVIAIGGVDQLLAVSAEQLWWLAASSVLLFGYVYTWYSAVRLLPVTVASALLVVAAPITALLNATFVTHRWEPRMVMATGLVVIGVAFLYRHLHSVRGVPITSHAAAAGRGG